MTKPATGPGAIVFSVLLLAVFASPGCRRAASSDANGPTSAPSTGATAQDQGAPAAAAGTTVSAETLQAICSNPCAGPLADIRVFRGTDGAVGRVLMMFDFRKCTEAQIVYFDASGQITEQYVMHPVVAGSPEEQAFTNRHNRQIEGLTAAESLSCP